MASFRTLGVLGMTSLVATPLVSFASAAGWRVIGCSRRAVAGDSSAWCRPGEPEPGGADRVATWVTLCPLWVVPEWLPWFESLGIRRLVAVSSTSVLTRPQSPSAADRRVAAALAAAEEAVAVWAASRGVTLCLLRPTMIYDGVTDGTVAAIARFVRRWGWFPVVGPARGLRQPVHAADVAAACVAAITTEQPASCYELSGGRPLAFRDLVAEVFIACGLRPRIVHLPWPMWHVAAPLVRLVAVNASGVARRMNEDLSCDHAAAARDLGFRPRPFSAGELAGLPGFVGAAGRRAVA